MGELTDIDLLAEVDRRMGTQEWNLRTARTSMYEYGKWVRDQMAEAVRVARHDADALDALVAQEFGISREGDRPPS